jgi:hypothetical protein
LKNGMEPFSDSARFFSARVAGYVISETAF